MVMGSVLWMGLGLARNIVQRHPTASKRSLNSRRWAKLSERAAE